MNEGNLGKLVVSISADMTELEKGLKTANDKVQTTAQKIADTTQKISKTMTIVGGAIVGAFGLMIKSAVDYGDQIYEVSQRTGIATETLSRLKYVADQTESSFEAVATGLRYLNRSIFEAQQGTNSYSQTFRNLGISLQDATGKTKDAETVFMELADLFSKSSDNSAKTAMAMELFGRSGVSLIPILNLGSKGIRELSAEADKLGLTLSKDNAVAIDQFSDGMKALKASMGGLFLEVANNVIPMLTRFVRQVQDVLAQVKSWSNAHPVLSRNIAETTLKIGALLLVLGTFGLSIVAISKGLVAVWTTLNLIVPLATTFSLIKMGMLTAEIGTVTAACGLLQTAIPIIAAGFAGWTIGKLIGEMKQVQGFFDWLVGADKAKAFEAQATEENKRAVANNPYAPVDLGRIEISKSASDLEGKKEQEDPLANIERQKAIQQEYADWYQAMQDGLVTIDGNANMQKIALAQQETQEKMALVQTYNNLWMQAHQGMYAFANMLVQTLHQGLSTAITGIITGTMKAKDAFKMLGEQMVQSIVSYLVQQAVAWAISRALAGVATSVAGTMAASLTVAWAPAAFLASVATLGGAVAAGSAALTTGMIGAIAMAGTTAASSSGAAVAGFATGTDSVPAMLTPQEMIVPRSFADAIRSGDLTLSGPSRSVTTNNNQASVVVNFAPQINTDIDMERAAEKLGLIIEEKLRGVR